MEQKNGFKAGESINGNGFDYNVGMLNVMNEHPDEVENNPELKAYKKKLERELVNVTKKLEELESAIKENEDAKAKLDDLETRFLDDPYWTSDYNKNKAVAEGEVAMSAQKIKKSRDEIASVRDIAKNRLDDIEIRMLDGQIAKSGVDIDDGIDYSKEAERLKKVIEDADNALENTKDFEQESDFKIPGNTVNSNDAPKVDDAAKVDDVPKADDVTKVDVAPVEEKHFEFGNPEGVKIKVVPVEEKHFEIVEPEDEDTPEDEGIFDDDEDEREYDDDNEEEEKTFVFGNLNQQRAYERLMRKSNERSKEGSRNALKKTAKKWGIRAALVGLGVLLAFGASKMAGGRSSEKANEKQNINNQSNSISVDNGGYKVENEKNNDYGDVVIVDAEKNIDSSDAETENDYEVPDNMSVAFDDGNGNRSMLEIDTVVGSPEYYGEKLDRNQLTAPIYDYQNIENLTPAQRAEQIAENVFNQLDMPEVHSQFLGGGFDYVKFADDMGLSMDSFADLRNVHIVSQQDEEFRKTCMESTRKLMYDLLSTGSLSLYTVKAGEVHDSLCITNKAGDGEMDIPVYTNMEPEAAPFDFDVLQSLDEYGRNKFDTNEFGGFKYNFLKAAGVIPEGATKGEAQEIMLNYKILGISGLCTQIIWEEVGYESSASKWDEYFVPPVTEENPPVEIPPIVEEPPIETPPVVEEPPIETPPSVVPKTEESTTRNDVTKLPVTPESATQGKTVVTEQETGQIDTQVVNSSSEKAEENFLNGGDQGGGNTDADGGGSTNINTEATYNPTNTEGWQGVEQSRETGTQDVAEPATPEEVNQINNSEANPNTIPSTSLEQGDREAPNDAQKANMMSDMF